MYEKLDGGLLSLECTLQPALRLISDSTKSFAIQARASGIELHSAFDSRAFAADEVSHPTIFVNADKSKISQVTQK
jgi:hypothetical protein